jgi:hypothetical protein
LKLLLLRNGDGFEKTRHFLQWQIFISWLLKDKAIGEFRRMGGDFGSF